MRLLLDTHALLWWFHEDNDLGTDARAAISDGANEVFVSVVSLWEIVVKTRVRKLDANIGLITAEMSRQKLRLLNVKTVHLTILETLPMHHRDPFDQLLIAQAIGERAIFMSSDAKIAKYPVQLFD